MGKKNEKEDYPETVIKFQSDRQFFCFYHKDQELVFYQAKLLEFELERGSGKQSYATDLIFMCPKCGLIYTFGVSVSKDQFEEMKNYAVEVTEDGTLKKLEETPK